MRVRWNRILVTVSLLVSVASFATAVFCLHLLRETKAKDRELTDKIAALWHQNQIQYQWNGAIMSDAKKERAYVRRVFASTQKNGFDPHFKLIMTLKNYVESIDHEVYKLRDRVHTLDGKPNN